MSNTSRTREQHVAKAQSIWNKEIVHWDALRIEFEFVDLLADQIEYLHIYAEASALAEAAREARELAIQKTYALYERRRQKFMKAKAA